jgi:sugar O-acyltransferase (sialic acid O-acetyltransferase NeuD family)
MGNFKFLIPKDNASDSSVKIGDIYVSNFKFVEIGDLIFDYETSKANFEVHTENRGFINFNIQAENVINTGEIAFELFEKLEDAIKSAEKKINTSISFSESKISKKAEKIINDKGVDIVELTNHFNNKDFISEADVLEYLNIDHKYSLGSLSFEKNDIVIFGAGGHALQCLEIILNSEYRFRGFIANEFHEEFRENIIGSTIDDLFLMKNDGLSNVVIGFGLLQNLKKKNEIFNNLLNQGFNLPNLISSSASISSFTNIPECSGIQILQGAVIGPRVDLEKNVIINSNATVSHHCKISSGCFIAPGAILAGGVLVEKYSLIGMGSTIYMNIVIPECSIIQNNSNIF